jgi:hypothetical protein
MLARVLCGIVTLFAVGACNGAQAAKRVALVVRQGAYTNLTELSNPKLDPSTLHALISSRRSKRWRPRLRGPSWRWCFSPAMAWKRRKAKSSRLLMPA